MHSLLNYDCMGVLDSIAGVHCIFADPPDAIGLKYGEYNDRRKAEEYVEWLSDFVFKTVQRCNVMWLSYNARWTFEVGKLVVRLLEIFDFLEAKPCVQTFTFGQHNHHDLGNNHRPLVRFLRMGTPLYPDQVRVPSWRQLHGDARADSRGRVPGDVFDFPRVTGNSRQRRNWHPTQLNEGLVARCLQLVCKEGDSVLDPFAGTGTTLRVCRQLNLPCTLIELDSGYCKRIAEEHSMIDQGDGTWTL